MTLYVHVVYSYTCILCLMLYMYTCICAYMYTDKETPSSWHFKKICLLRVNNWEMVIRMTEVGGGHLGNPAVVGSSPQPGGVSGSCGQPVRVRVVNITGPCEGAAWTTCLCEGRPHNWTIWGAVRMISPCESCPQSQVVWRGCVYDRSMWRSSTWLDDVRKPVWATQPCEGCPHDRAV